jgi:hypothetical protein
VGCRIRGLVERAYAVAVLEVADVGEVLRVEILDVREIGGAEVVPSVSHGAPSIAINASAGHGCSQAMPSTAQAPQ